MALNHEFKRLVSEWQTTSAAGYSADEWDELVRGVMAIDQLVQPLIGEAAGCVARLEGYGARFQQALTSMRDGEASMLASPLEDSYHTVWFEFHEELIGACGRNRATEEAAR